MLGLGSSLAKGGASLLTFVKDNLKLYLDFKSTKSNTLKFPSEGSTSFAYTDKIMFSQQTFTGAFSVVCWFNGDVNTPYKRLFGDSSPPSGTNDILVKDVSGQVSIRINGSYKANINNVPNNTWSHLAFTRDDNGNIKSYLNGVASGTHTSTDTFTLDNIGGDGGGAVMSMCNAGLWSSELSQEEVQSIMNKSYSQLKGVEKTSLVSWWALDSQSDGVVQPATGELLGSELIPDGEFTDTSLWDAGADVAIGTGISFVNGQAVWAPSCVVEIKQDITINSGKLYKVVLDIDSVTSGTIRNNVGSYGGSFTTAGVKTEYITGSGSRFYLVGFSGFNGVLNSVSVKEVLSNTGVLK